MDGAQLANEHHRDALDARQRRRRGDRLPLAQPRGRLDLRPYEMQIGSDAAEPIFVRDAMDLADQLLLPARHELRHQTAEDDEPGDDLGDQLVPDNVLLGEVDEPDPLDPLEDRLDLDESRGPGRRQVDLGDVARDDHP